MDQAPITPADADTIAKAAALLRDGKLVAFPTETVYGLGADATNDKAVAAVFEAKGRPQFNPLIIHVAEVHACAPLVKWNENARVLATQFWPGPLTLVLPRADKCPVSLLAGAGLDTLAVRIPSHPVAQKLLKAVNKPVAAPSANLSGKLSPTTALHVAESLGDKVDMILAGGKSQVGLESTVLDLTSSPPRILRPGGILKDQIERIIGKISDAGPGGEIKSPGMTESHYAPNTPLRLNATGAEKDEGFLTFGNDALAKGGAARLNLSEKGDLTEAAANLFAMLRQLDQKNLRGIAVMPIPEKNLGIAINDRLRRAAAR